jgi:FixJ family two-component response regulator
MLFDTNVVTQDARMRMERAEKQAAENWRFRNLKTRESQVLAAVITSVLGLFVH